MAASESIPSMIIPMWGDSLLVPNTAVAEVIGFTTPEDGNGEDFLGFITWRGLKVPVLNLEEDSPPVDSIGSSSRIAVFNTPSGKAEQPFVAVLVNGIPRLNSIRTGDLKYATDEIEELPKGVQARVMLGQEIVRLVDLPILEQVAEEVAKV